jgi:uncharacterized protein YprB with RNaseH-like and TPR domain
MAINLGDRLRQVISGAVPRVAPETLPGARAAHGPAVIERSYGNEPEATGAIDGPYFANVLAGEWVESRDGAVLIVDRYYAANRMHGRIRVGDCVETIESGLEQLLVIGRGWPGRDPRPYTSRLCFFDLETTGLAGGAGTQAFLIGCAIIEGGGIRVRQYLLPGFQHERALLSLVAGWLPAQGTLVSFNGRSFDIPLIETRYMLHRLPFPFGEMPHLDMLHPARRLWQQRPMIAAPMLDDESCRLSVLERHLAGYHRVGDVAGFEIPSRYFRFIRMGDAHGLEAVLEHNRIDLISLALVTARAISLIAQGPSAAQHPREALGLGRLFERAGSAEDAEASFAYAASLAARAGREPDVRAEALRRLAVCRRRAGRMAEAASAWEELLTVAGCPMAFRREAREALAIHHEHRSRNLQTARMLVLDVLADNAGARAREAAQYRLQRIERKMAVREQGGLMAALECLDQSV